MTRTAVAAILRATGYSLHIEMSIDDVADDVADDGSVAASHFRPSWPTQAAWSWRRVARAAAHRPAGLPGRGPNNSKHERGMLRATISVAAIRRARVVSRWRLRYGRCRSRWGMVVRTSAA